MKFIQGHNRAQMHLFPISLNHALDQDNEVRLIDLFVDSLSLAEFGFKTDFIKKWSSSLSPLRFTQALYLWPSKQNSLVKRFRKSL